MIIFEARKEEIVDPRVGKEEEEDEEAMDESRVRNMIGSQENLRKIERALIPR